MKRIALPLFLLSFCIASAAPVPYPIQVRYAALTRVLNKLDFATFQTFFAPGFTNTGPDGKVQKRDEFLKEVEPLFKDYKRGIAKERLISAKKEGENIAVSVNMTLDLIGPKGKVRIHEVGVDTWTKVGGKWLMLKTVDSKFDVKPIGQKID